MIRINGHLGATVLSAFPAMALDLKHGQTQSARIASEAVSGQRLGLRAARSADGLRELRLAPGGDWGLRLRVASPKWRGYRAGRSPGAARSAETWILAAW